MSERLINQYRILSSAQEPSRILMESRLRLIEEELQRRGLEEEGPSTASRTGSDTHLSLIHISLWTTPLSPAPFLLAGFLPILISKSLAMRSTLWTPGERSPVLRPM